MFTGQPCTQRGFLQFKHLDASSFTCSGVKLLSTGSKLERLSILSCSFTLCLSTAIASSLHKKYKSITDILIKKYSLCKHFISLQEYSLRIPLNMIL